MKVYTKTGDSGITSLFGGQRIEKDSVRIEAYGHVDELNSQIGVILVGNLPKEIAQKLTRIQKELFVLGADLATPPKVKTKIQRINKSYVTRLEREIDQWDKMLPKLQNFILPGGGEIGAKLHLARTITRRAERAVVNLNHQEKVNKNAQIYLNRLSDWLFVLARYVNKLEGAKENIWKRRS